MSKRAVRSFTAASPRVSDSKIARRLGSASAWKILFSPRAGWSLEEVRVDETPALLEVQHPKLVHAR
jgi:hypothetical protein